MNILQNSQMFRVRNFFLTGRTSAPGTGVFYFRTHGSFGYRYELLTKLTEVSGVGITVLHNPQNCPVRVLPG